MTLTARRIHEARRRIRGIAQRTPLLHSPALSAALPGEVFLKLESVQETGSFKLRGAVNRMAVLAPEERRRGVITVSTGNHGRAVAYAAHRMGIPAVVCLTDRVPEVKRRAIAALGAEIRIAGATQDEAEAAAHRIAEAEGRTMIHPFDDPLVIAGQGTVGLELLEDLPALDTVVVPLSGGGLAGGIALALESADPGIRVVGVSMERGAAMYESIRAGSPVEVEEYETLADCLSGGIGADNRYTLDLCRRLLDAVHLVSEAEIAEALRFLFREERLVAEGGAAVGVAALLSGKICPSPTDRTVVVISGRNIDPDRLLSVVG